MKEITSVHNAAAQLLRELQKPRARREHGLFVCESAKMVGEAVALHLAQTLFVEKGREAEYAQMAAQAESMGCALYAVSQAVMQAVSTAKTPQGIVCTAKIPEPPKTLTGKRIVALDGVQDPGNVGTILRTADALDIPVTLLEGCADPYSPKTVRASMGAVFRTQPVKADWAEVKAACGVAGIPVAVTALSQRAKDLRNADLRGMAVVIGSEGQGVRREILESADGELIIPMNKRCESLNAAVAAAIVMWQMKQ